MINRIEDLVNLGLSSISQFYFLITPLYYFQAIGFFTFITKEENFFSLIYLIFLCTNLFTIYLIIAYMKIRFNTSYIYARSHKKILYKKTNKDCINYFVIERIFFKRKNYIKYCKTCNIQIPLRTYHCFICKKCYYKLEFHSNIFKTCINYYNLKTYLNFLIIFCLRNILLFISVLFFMQTENNKFERISILILISIEFLWSIKSIIEIILNIFRNETFKEKEFINKYLSGNVGDIFSYTQLPKGNSMVYNRKELNSFNKGFVKNFKEIYGKNVFYWFNFSFTGDKNIPYFDENINILPF